MMPGVEEPPANPATHDFEALFRAEADRLYRTLYAFTGGRRDIAEEAGAEAFARAIAQGDRLRDPLAWIYTAGFRLAIDELRRDRRRSPPAEGEAPAHELEGVIDALRKLSPNQRAAIVLRHVLDLETDEVAERMGIAAPTVRVHLLRARRRLRDLLGTEEDET
jgi:RNA polymerase sigma-70 factor, ECF subfamily